MQIGEAKGFGEMRSAAVTAQATEQADSKKEDEKNGLSIKSNDTVQISTQGKNMAAAGTLASGKAAPGKATPEESAAQEDPLLKSVQDRIKELQQEIQELQGSNMDPKEKQQKLAQLNQELATQNSTLQELQNKDSSGSSSRYGKGGLIF